MKGEQRTSMFEANGGIGLKDGENVRNRCKGVVVCIGVKNCIVDTSDHLDPPLHTDGKV